MSLRIQQLCFLVQEDTDHDSSQLKKVLMNPC